ncbi:hypothetical protein DIPPA_28900 [Diplonema papillatum]|nr:hypothetical protein DIPPA_28900 [Diplonema papillatum]
MVRPTSTEARPAWVSPTQRDGGASRRRGARRRPPASPGGEPPKARPGEGYAAFFKERPWRQLLRSPPSPDADDPAARHYPASLPALEHLAATPNRKVTVVEPAFWPPSRLPPHRIEPDAELQTEPLVWDEMPPAGFSAGCAGAYDTDRRVSPARRPHSPPPGARQQQQRSGSVRAALPAARRIAAEGERARSLSAQGLCDANGGGRGGPPSPTAGRRGVFDATGMRERSRSMGSVGRGELAWAVRDTGRMKEDGWRWAERVGKESAATLADMRVETGQLRTELCIERAKLQRSEERLRRFQLQSITEVKINALQARRGNLRDSLLSFTAATTHRLRRITTHLLPYYTALRLYPSYKHPHARRARSSGSTGVLRKAAAALEKTTRIGVCRKFYTAWRTAHQARAAQERAEGVEEMWRLSEDRVSRLLERQRLRRLFSSWVALAAARRQPPKKADGPPPAPPPRAATASLPAHEEDLMPASTRHERQAAPEHGTKTSPPNPGTNPPPPPESQRPASLQRAAAAAAATPPLNPAGNPAPARNPGPNGKPARSAVSKRLADSYKHLKKRQPAAAAPPRPPPPAAKAAAPGKAIRQTQVCAARAVARCRVLLRLRACFSAWLAACCRGMVARARELPLAGQRWSHEQAAAEVERDSLHTAAYRIVAERQSTHAHHPRTPPSAASSPRAHQQQSPASLLPSAPPSAHSTPAPTPFRLVLPPAEAAASELWQEAPEAGQEAIAARRLRFGGKPGGGGAAGVARQVSALSRTSSAASTNSSEGAHRLIARLQKQVYEAKAAAKEHEKLASGSDERRAQAVSRLAAVLLSKNRLSRLSRLYGAWRSILQHNNSNSNTNNNNNNNTGSSPAIVPGALELLAKRHLLAAGHARFLTWRLWQAGRRRGRERAAAQQAASVPSVSSSGGSSTGGGGDTSGGETEGDEDDGPRSARPPVLSDTPLSSTSLSPSGSPTGSRLAGRGRRNLHAKVAFSAVVTEHVVDPALTPSNASTESSPADWEPEPEGTTPEIRAEPRSDPRAAARRRLSMATARHTYEVKIRRYYFYWLALGARRIGRRRAQARGARWAAAVGRLLALRGCYAALSGYRRLRQVQRAYAARLRAKLGRNADGVVAFQDPTTGNRISLSPGLKGLQYSVNGEARPAIRAISLKSESLLVFPGVHPRRGVTIPVEDAHHVLPALRELAHGVPGVSHNFGCLQPFEEKVAACPPERAHSRSPSRARSISVLKESRATLTPAPVRPPVEQRTPRSSSRVRSVDATSPRQPSPLWIHPPGWASPPRRHAAERSVSRRLFGDA